MVDWVDATNPDVDGVGFADDYQLNEFSSFPNLAGAHEGKVQFVRMEHLIDWVKQRGMADKSILLQIIAKKIDDVHSIADLLKESVLSFKATITDTVIEVKEGESKNELQNKEYARRVAMRMIEVLDSIEYPDYFSNEQLSHFLNFVTTCRRQIYKEAAQYVRKLDKAFKDPMRPIDAHLVKWEEAHNQLTVIVSRFGEDCYWLGKNLDKITHFHNSYVSLTEKWFSLREIRNNFQVANKVYTKCLDAFTGYQSNPVLCEFIAMEEKCVKNFNFLRDELNQFSKIAKKMCLSESEFRGSKKFDGALLSKYSDILQRDCVTYLHELEAEEFFKFVAELAVASTSGDLDSVLEVAMVKKAKSMPERIDKELFNKNVQSYAEMKVKIIAMEKDPEFLRLVQLSRQNRRDLKLAVDQLKLKRNEINGYISSSQDYGARFSKLRKDIHEFLKDTFEDFSLDIQVEYKYWEFAKKEVAETADKQVDENDEDGDCGTPVTPL